VSSLSTVLELQNISYCCQLYTDLGLLVKWSDFNQIWSFSADFRRSSEYQMSPKSVYSESGGLTGRS